MADEPPPRRAKREPHAQFVPARGRSRELEIGEERLHTVAIETPEADAARQALRDLGLEAAANESYAALLQRRLF